MKQAERPGRGPLVVQQSFPQPRATTNPYIVMLRDSISALPDVQLRTFGWRAALLGRYDVFHVHWPEILLAGQSRAKTWLRQLLTVALLVRLRLTRTPVVRTLHNVKRPAGLSRTASSILALLDRQTSLVILLNSSTVAPDGVPSETIVHGHYRGWFARYPKPEARPGQLSYFGLIRPYKGVDRLLAAFAELPGDYTLEVAGNPSADLVTPLTELASRDPRVKLIPRYIPDEELVRVACSAELVVLPYREMHNSGGALTALSLDRPVLVPHNEVNARLSREVGPGWVHTYRGELTSAVLARALSDVRSGPRADRPDLSAREWDVAGSRHVAAYRRALTLVREPRLP
ncbi:MAG TPA: glycosyl transferase [Propionibacteriaceae bacterium]